MILPMAEIVKHANDEFVMLCDELQCIDSRLQPVNISCIMETSLVMSEVEVYLILEASNKEQIIT